MALFLLVVLYLLTILQVRNVVWITDRPYDPDPESEYVKITTQKSIFKPKNYIFSIYSVEHSLKTAQYVHFSADFWQSNDLNNLT